MTREVDAERLDEQLIGRVIAGKFGLKSCIGVGASGAVFQADQITLGRTVAVKVLRPDLATDARFVGRFQDEAMAASRLNHPNTVSVIDYGQTEDGLLYLVMEYLRGQTLSELLAELPLEAARVADLVMQVLSGLEEAHAAGVVHADLKADNIVVEHRRGNWDLVKVVDFGIARLLGKNEEPDAHDRTVCGTPEYMAPELISGYEPTFASDVYAVGVLLYELLVGRTPFAGRETMAILTRHLQEAPAPPSSLRREVDATLERAALRALEKSPDDRFPDAAAFREALAVVGRRAQNDGQVLCSACGVMSSESFKFCPECGEARSRVARGTGTDHAAPREATEGAPAGDSYQDLATVERVKPVVVSRPTRQFAPREDRTAGGILPLPLLGREEELATLAAFFSGRSRSHMLQVVGPPGSGRGRLVREACARTDPAEVAIYLTTPDPSGLAGPYHPIRALVAGVLGLPPVCSLGDLRGALGEIGLGDRDLPGISELFGHPAQLSQLEPPVRRRELLVATVRVLQAVSEARRTILVFEGVERYDHPSQDVLRRLAEGEGDHALRLLVTNGPDFALRWPGLVERLNLERLEAEALEALARHLSHKGHRDMPDAASLGELTGGLPGHIHELTRFIIEGGSVSTAPRGVADLVAARLELLPHEVRLVCQAAAVFGQEVTTSALRATLGDRLEREAVDEALSVLMARGILTEEAGILRFEQTIVRDVTYDSTPADVRRELHAGAVEALQHISRDPALLGHHHEHARDLREATELLARAGDEAVRQLDDRGACALYNRALACARRVMLSEGEEQNRIAFVTTSVKLADALRATGELGLARGLIEEARSHSEDAAILKAHLLRASAQLHSAEGEAESAIATLREAIGLSIMTGQRDLLAELYLDLTTMYLRAGQKSEATNELVEGIDLVTAGEGAAAVSGPQPLWRMLLRLASLRGAAGRRHEAIELAEQALTHAERIHSRLGIARVHSTLAEQLERLGKERRAHEHRRLAVEEMRSLGDRRGTAELLLSGARPTGTVHRINPATVAEARTLAEEVGWREGVRRADRASGEN